MRTWLSKFIVRLWPWSKIDELERALTAQNQMLITSNDRYITAYSDGYRHYLQTWIMQANMFHGKEPFTDGQMKLMISLYEAGYDRREALYQLNVAENSSLGRTWIP